MEHSVIFVNHVGINGQHGDVFVFPFVVVVSISSN